ncbi:MAG: glycosyltransferase family 39 protein, partial [Thermodesulfobacteriota bacterium]
MDEKKLPLYSILILIILAIVVIILRFHSLGEPLERDITGYSYLAQELLSGKTLYTELWDHHPPGIYWVYMVANTILGYNPAAVFIIGALLSTLSLLFIFLIIRRLAETRAALFGAFFWALASTSIYLEANQPNTELFMNTFLLISIWAYLKGDRENLKFLIISGFFFALSSAFKTVVIFPFLALCIYAFVSNYKSDQARLSRALQSVLCLIVPCALLWVAIFLYFILVGRFTDFWEAVFLFNLHYSGGMLINLWSYISTPSLFFHPAQRELIILAILSIGYLLTGPKNPRPLKRWF